MKRFVLPVAAAALLAAMMPFKGDAVGPFDKKLSADQQILQALNRLTFGPRPGDIEEVRHMGVEKWIALQLHPEKIAENPVLEARLKPLETLRLDPEQVIKDYAPPPPIVFRTTPLQELLNQEQIRKVQVGTPEERKAVLTALDPDKRKQVLLVIPQQNIPSEFTKEVDAARQEQAAQRQMENRKRNPTLADLLTPDQADTLRRGNPEQVRGLFDFLDPAQRPIVAGAMVINQPQAVMGLPDIRREGLRVRNAQQVVFNDLKEGKLYRAVYSNRQLEEVLVDFWFNHFNVYDAKQVQVQSPNQPYRMMLTSYERDAIRPHVLGHFKDLLLATARHPAMLWYLDNWESMGPNGLDVGPFAAQPGLAQQLARLAHGLNENYGREVMELHTLGVNGGYTQQDVINVARCFTGWTIGKPTTSPEFAFSGFMHDTGEKNVLGHKIPAGGGEQDGLQVIDILAHHPSTAKFISKELAQRFVADDPPQSLVDRMAQTFTKTDGDLRAVMETMFTSPEFFSEGAWQAKVKSPLESVVSAVRATQAETIDSAALVQKVQDLGEPLYGKLEPTGYPNTGEAWLSTASVMGRLNFATTLVSGQVPGVKLDASRLEGKNATAIVHEVLGHDASPQTMEELTTGLQGKEPTPRALLGLVISSPDFQRR
jgi:uncharacterized protein (DUF1800 family)